MITKFARLEFELFTKPSKSDFLRVHQPLLMKNIFLGSNFILLSANRQMPCFYIPPQISAAIVFFTPVAYQNAVLVSAEFKQ